MDLKMVCKYQIMMVVNMFTFEIADKTVDPEERRYVRYYQWVCFCLFFQVRITLAFRLQMIHSGLSLSTFLIG